jgi:DNA (cytosine-5)-methyltransferase 1
VDVFCGCGGLTLGAAQAAIAIGSSLESVAAIDVDGEALEVHAANFGTKHVLHGNAANLVDFHVSGAGSGSKFAYEPELIDPTLAAEAGSVDLFLAGPPCQGHSNLNNRTRREDPRNLLYLTAVALAVGLRARWVVIENVPDVINDKSDVVSAAKSLLRSAGYRFLDHGILGVDAIGGAQTRKRFFLVAARDESLDSLTIATVGSRLRRDPQPLSWAIGDLLGCYGSKSHTGVMDTVPALSEENRTRIDHLFDHELYDLPDSVRPDCHKNGHTYPSVYGRLWWERPAQTITTGFLTPGRGRYVHPKERRVITPREAARIQTFPDTFRFIVNGHDPARNALTKWIGDAVPPLLGYAATLPLMMRGTSAIA